MKKKFYIETYGCQMNVADSEVVAAIMQTTEAEMTDTWENADVIILNTCSIRDNAEQKVGSRLRELKALLRNHKSQISNHKFQIDNRRAIIGVIGCMAERMGQELIDTFGVDFVAGPDAYLDIPNLLAQCEQGHKAMNVELNTTETYRQIIPARIGRSISGFVSIMRGCNNFCSYCVVPYTRGRERSRDVESILSEVRDLHARGYKEVTLLGQNVNSYRYTPGDEGKSIDFADLLEIVAEAVPDMRIRFTTSHPKDMSRFVVSYLMLPSAQIYSAVSMMKRSKITRRRSVSCERWGLIAHLCSNTPRDRERMPKSICRIIYPKKKK